MQGHDNAMIRAKGYEWLWSGARLRLQHAERTAQYEAIMQDRIKELAIEAGIPSAWISENGVLQWGQLERFAQLVAKDCAQLCMNRANRPFPEEEE